MSSQISQVYTNLAAVAVTVGSITPTAYLPDALPKTLDTAQAPCRVFDPSFGPDAAQFSFIAHGDKLADVLWTIHDILLWDAIGQDRGPLAVASTLVSYCGAYLDAMRSARPIVPGQQLELQLIEPEISFGLEWPRGTGRFWYGVVMRLTVYEALTGA